MKVIFLDIDGVLNCYHKDEKWQDRNDRVDMIHDDLVERLNDVLDRTGAYIVLSSTWRKSHKWRSTMRKSGIRRRFLGRTISLSSEQYEWEKQNPDKSGFYFSERGKEIQEWLDRHPKVTKYCVLDDDSDMLPHQKHFKTSIFEGGLTEEIAEEVIKYLGEISPDSTAAAVQ